ncbi:MAG: acyl carrier protein [Amaricoccus sp.]|uniref:acyl carrier protein n=1 Tax=Amaricoccus sp. TaxID=1872485 RepID=UPI0039E4B991
MTEIADRLRRVIADCLLADIARMTDDAHFVADLHADSLDRLEIFMALEDAFGVELPEEDGEAMQTVGDALRMVSAALGAVEVPGATP